MAPRAPRALRDSVGPELCPTTLPNRAQKPDLWWAIGGYVDEMVKTNQPVMQDWFNVAARVAGKMLQKMRFGVHPKQVAGISLVLIAPS